MNVAAVVFGLNLSKLLNLIIMFLLQKSGRPTFPLLIEQSDLFLFNFLDVLLHVEFLRVLGCRLFLFGTQKVLPHFLDVILDSRAPGVALINRGNGPLRLFEDVLLAVGGVELARVII